MYNACDMYPTERAGVIIVRIIACYCPNDTVYKSLMYFTLSIMFLFTVEKYMLISYDTQQ